MTKEELYSNLCIYDPRNPLHDDVFGDDEETVRVPRQKCCSCDNCFYGRDKLALTIIVMRDKLKVNLENLYQHRMEVSAQARFIETNLNQIFTMVQD